MSCQSCDEHLGEPSQQTTLPCVAPRLPAGVLLSLNVSDANRVVSLSPALKHPDVPGIRVEVNGQVRQRRVPTPTPSMPGCQPMPPTCAARGASGRLASSALPLSGEQRAACRRAHLPWPSKRADTAEPAWTKRNMFGLCLPCPQVLSRGGDVHANQLQDTTAAVEPHPSRQAWLGGCVCCCPFSKSDCTEELRAELASVLPA